MNALARYVPASILLLYHGAALALAAIHPLAPFALIGGTAGAFFLLSYQHIILVSFASLSVVKGFLIEQVPMFEIIDFSILLAGLSIVVILWQIAARGGAGRLDRQGHIILAYFSWVVWMFIATTYAPNADIALLKVGRFTLFTTILFLGPIALIADLRDSRLMLHAFIGYGIFAAMMMFIRLYDFATTLTLDPTSHRLTILGANPISVARILVVGISMVVAGMGRDHFNAKRWAPIVMLLLGAAVLTGSRGPLVSLVAAWIVLAILHGGRARVVIVKGLGGLGLAMLVFLILAPPELSSRFIDYSEGDFGVGNQGFAMVDTVNTRFNLWRLAISTWTSGLFPFLFGIGTAGFSSLFIWGTITYPHNLVLEVLVEYGLLGTVVFFWQFAWTTPRLLVSGDKNISAESFMWLAGIITFFFTTFFSGDLNDNRMLWFLVAAFIASRAADKRAPA